MTWVLRGPTEAQRGRCQGAVERGDISVGCEGCVGVCQGENGETCDKENIRFSPEMVRGVWESNCSLTEEHTVTWERHRPGQREAEGGVN